MSSLIGQILSNITKNVQVKVDLNGKSAAVATTIVGLAFVAGGCYITHDVLEHKKSPENFSDEKYLE